MKMLRLLPASLLAIILPCVHGDVEFTSPAAGANVEVGTIDVQWQDSGTDPSILDLTAYTLSLMVGGNQNKTMRPIATFQSGGVFADGNTASGTIPAGIAGGVQNGFFFKIESASRFGGTVVNYSSRFSINGLTGYTPAKYREAAEELDGSTDAPGAGDSTTTTISSPTTASARRTQQSTNAASAIPTSTPSTEPSKDFRGLSIAAQAGIGVAGVVVGGIIVGLIFWFMIRRKARKRAASENGRIYMGGKAEMSGETLSKKVSTSTTSTSSELSPDHETFEMNGQGPLREMGAGYHGRETEGSTTASEAEGSAAASEMEGSTVVYEMPAQRFSKGG